MKMKFCVVPDCLSSSANQPHLAYHKFPACPETRRIWMNRIKIVSSDLRHHTPQVCSKHFRKDDYLPHHKTSKRMLKKGAVPSSFPWDSSDSVILGISPGLGLTQETSKPKQKLKPNVGEVKTDDDNNTPANDNIVDSGDESFKEADITKSSGEFKDPEKIIIESENSDRESVTDDTSSVSCTPEKAYGRNSNHGAAKYLPGVRLEAKDLRSSKWYKAKVVEVDWEDEEVLIHFDKWSQRFDEWIPMDSSRLRPARGHSPNSQSAFRVGETVMASWTDNRKYAARIKSILSGDKYEVLFFDGFSKVVKGHKISKGSEETLAMDPGLFHNAGATTMTKAERRERKRKIGSVAELFQIKKKYVSDSVKSALKKRPSAPSDVEIKEEANPKKITGSLEERKKEHDGKTRQRAFPVIKGFIDEDKSRSTGDKRGKPRPSSSNTLDYAIAGSSKVVSAHPPRGKRRKRDDIEASDYNNWEPDGEEAWVVESSEGLRRSIVVKDERLPSGWAKHSIQRKSGNSAGKWDVFLVSPTGRRFRSRKEMVAYFVERGEDYNSELFDFTLRCKMRRKSKDTEHTREKILPKRKKTARKDSKSPMSFVDLADDEASANESQTPPSRRIKTLLPKPDEERGLAASPPPPHPSTQGSPETEKQSEGRVSIGNLKIQMDNDAFVCPKDGCLKHFRKENLLQMHIKHYHPEYSKFMGSTPNVADLAYARTVGEPLDDIVPKARPFNASFFEQINRFEAQKKTKMLQVQQTTKALSPAPSPVEVPLPSEKVVDAVPKEKKDTKPEPKKIAKILPPVVELPLQKPLEELPVEDILDGKPIDIEEYIKPLPCFTPTLAVVKEPAIPKVFPTTPTAGIKTLLPVVRTTVKIPPQEIPEEVVKKIPSLPAAEPSLPRASPTPLDKRSSSNTELTPLQKSKIIRKRRLSDMYIETLKKRRFGKLTKCYDDTALDNRGSNQIPSRFPNQQPKYRIPKKKKVPSPLPLSQPQQQNLPDSSMDMSEPDGSPASAVLPLTEEETFEQLQKRDIINCTCGIMEEDGLMIQCDLCLCWQHVLCNNNTEEVPDKYVCYICLNPARERKSRHYIHDQYWLKDGTLPSLSFRTKDEAAIAKRESRLKKSHDLTGGLLELKEVIHSLRVKLAIAEQPDHPKLYLWAEKTATSSSSNPSESVDNNLKQEPLIMKSDPMNPENSQPSSSNVPDIKIEHELSKADGLPTRIPDNVAAKESSEVELVSPAEIPCSQTVEQASLQPGKAGQVAVNMSQTGHSEALDIKNTVIPNRIADEFKMNASAVQDHTYVHRESRAEENNKIERMPECFVDKPVVCTLGEEKISVPPEESLKLDTHILAQALTSGDLSDTGFSAGTNTDLTSAGDLNTGLIAGLNVNAGLSPSVNTTMNADLSPGLSTALNMGNTLDAATQNQLLQFPICRSELMRFANSMADNLKDASIDQTPLPPAPMVSSVPQAPQAPQPEKPIDPVECRLNLLDHIEDYQDQLGSRLTSIDEQISALELEDPEPPSEETIDFYPQTKHTLQMLMRDLLTMKKLAVAATGYTHIKR